MQNLSPHIFLYMYNTLTGHFLFAAKNYIHLSKHGNVINRLQTKLNKAYLYFYQFVTSIGKKFRASHILMEVGIKPSELGA